MIKHPFRNIKENILYLRKCMSALHSNSSCKIDYRSLILEQEIIKSKNILKIYKTIKNTP